MIVSGLWDVTALLQLAPGLLLSVELIGIFAVGIILYSAEDNSFIVENGRFVMRNLSGNSSVLLDALPLHTGIAMKCQIVQCAQIYSPHRSNWANLDISSTMDVQTTNKSNDEK